MPINKRKAVGKKLRGNYPRQKLINAVFDVLLRNKTSSEAAKKHQIPARTIRRWAKRGREALKKLLPEEDQVFDIKDYNGPDRGLCHEDEVTLKSFIEDAELIGIPRSRARCAVDIQEYVREQQLVVPFTNDKPGAGYFERFCSDVDGWPIKFKKPQEVTSYLERNIDLDAWMIQVKQYFVDKEMPQICDKRLLFVLESQSFKTVTSPSRHLTVVVIYNGLGEILRWIIVTDGTQLSDDLVIQHGPSVMLLKTEKGLLNYTAVKSALILVRREMTTLDLEGCSLVYLDGFAAEHVNFIVWKYCCKSNIRIMAIPRKLFWSMKAFKLGAMGKYYHKMLFYMYHRFINIGAEMSEFNFVHVHQQIIAQKFQPHLITSLRFLKLNSVVSKQCPVVADPSADSNLDVVQPSSSSGTKSPDPVLKRSQKKTTSKKKKGKDIRGQSIAIEPSDTLELFKDIGTQTIETAFAREQLHSMIKYTMTTIRVQDFESDVE